MASLGFLHKFVAANMTGEEVTCSLIGYLRVHREAGRQVGCNCAVHAVSVVAGRWAAQ